MFHVKLASHIVDFNQANYNNNALDDRNGYTVMKKVNTVLCTRQIEQTDETKNET